MLAMLEDHKMAIEGDDRRSREFFLRTRREATVAGIIWAVFFVWVVGVSYAMGYGEAQPSYVAGIPGWVLWGILLPFVLATIVNSVFALVYLRDEDEKI